MTKKKLPSFKLSSQDKQHSLELKNVDYLGTGAYTCQLIVNSNGFMCDREYGFDNDEYFLSKLNTILTQHNDEAVLMDLEADSFIRFQPGTQETVFVVGYIVEHTNVTHSIEFAFTLEKQALQKFAQAFEKMVRSNI